MTKHVRIIDKIFYFYMNIASDRKWRFNKHIGKQLFYEKIFKKLKFYQIGFGDWSSTLVHHLQDLNELHLKEFLHLKKKVVMCKLK